MKEPRLSKDETRILEQYWKLVGSARPALVPALTSLDRRGQGLSVHQVRNMSTRYTAASRLNCIIVGISLLPRTILSNKTAAPTLSANSLASSSFAKDIANTWTAGFSCDFKS